jgi:choline-sulfatase
MNRRQFLQHLAIGAGSAALARAALPGRPARLPRKKNLLFIWTDQQRFDTLANYGNSRVQAPNLNAVAGQSIQFEQAYVTQPVCTPSRSSMMTGLWPHQTGCTSNNIALPQTSRCLPQLLGDSDYRTGYIGKWHLGDEAFAQHGFDEWVSTEDMYESHFSAGRDRSTKTDYWHYLHDRGYQPDKGQYYSRQFACGVPIEDGKPAFQARKAKDFLTRHRHDPFVLHVSYLEPHTPYISPLHELYKPEEMRLDDSYAQEDMDGVPRRYRLRRAFFEQAHGYLSDLDRKDITTQYWGNISVVDRSIGQILTHLEQLGLADDTIVVFTSDHGDQMSAHGMWFKEVMYQESLRVPYLIRVPGARGGRRISSPVSHIDLVPTLLELMGASIPAALSGESLAPLIRDEVSRPRQPFVFAEWSPDRSRQSIDYMAARTHPEWAPYTEESSRLALSPDGWKLCLSDIDHCQLYNLRDDPHEQHNLYSSGSHRDVVARLTREIERWRDRTNDTAFKMPA